MAEMEPAYKKTKLNSDGRQRYSDHQLLHELAEWVVHSGGYISDTLELYQDKGNGFSARVTAKSDRNVGVGSALEFERVTLVSCPRSLIFSLANPNPSFPASFLKSPLSIHAKACFHLCHDLILGEKSWFWPYIRLLPETFDTPLYFSDDEMERLAGTNLGAGDVVLRKQMWMEEWETGKRLLEGLERMENVQKYTWDLYLRAATIYTSRSFPSKLVGITVDFAISGAGDSANNSSFPVLIPLVDILNHKPNTKIIWEPTSTSFSLQTPENLPVGSQVFNNYGPKGNEELLMGYGFVIPENPTDSLAMKFTIQPRGPAADAWDRRDLRQKWTEVFHLTRSTELDGEKGDSIALESDWPEALVDLFRILVANENEILSLEIGDPNATPISIRNELAVALGLKAAINQKLASIRKYDISETSPASSYREGLADIYRKGQEEIIVSKIKKLDSFLEYYARGSRLSLTQYLADNSDLAQQLDQNPLPVEEIEGEDGPFYEEIIAKEELVFLVAVLRECFIRENGNNSSTGSKSFWDTFTQALLGNPEISLDYLVESNEVMDAESEGIYDAVADYCNLLEAELKFTSGIIGREVSSAHISWAWDVVRTKCITLGQDTFITL